MRLPSCIPENWEAAAVPLNAFVFLLAYTNQFAELTNDN